MSEKTFRADLDVFGTFLDSVHDTIQDAIKTMYTEREKILQEYITVGGTSDTQLSDYMIMECQGGWGGLTNWLRDGHDKWVIVTPLPSIAPNAAVLVRRVHG